MVALAGCGDDRDRGATQRDTATAEPTRTAPASAPRPALCIGATRVRVIGRVTSPSATELSGLVLSRTRRGVLWTHNDSGDVARLLAVTTAGRTVAEVTLDGAENVDWEDIALGPNTSLLAGDIGDNLGRRSSVVVYRVDEPRTSGTVAVAARYELRYPDGGRDAEALLFDRASGSIVIVTKSFGGEAGVYVAREPSSRRVTTLRRAATIRLGPGEPVTAGDVSGDGTTIALRTYDKALLWRLRAGETIAAALGRRPCAADAELLREGQGEALALTRDGRAFITVPEGPRPALRRYEPRAEVSTSSE
jgi:hypothetical protein